MAVILVSGNHFAVELLHQPRKAEGTHGSDSGRQCCVRTIGARAWSCGFVRATPLLAVPPARTLSLKGEPLLSRVREGRMNDKT